MHPFTIAFLFFLALGVVLQAWLKFRQIHYVRAHRNQVPEAFASVIKPEDHSKAADYTIAKNKLSFWELGISTGLLLAFTLGGGIGGLDGLWRQFDWHPYLLGAGVILGVFLINAVVELPISIYSTFVIEEKFGFNRMTPGLFIADLFKAFVLMMLLGVSFLIATLWFMDATGSYWWLWVWALWTGFSLFLTWAYPTFIAPMFNKFSPLEDEALKQRIEKLLERCGFRSSGVFVMDGSKRSAHGNAYFTGVGRSKRIVFFDTLIKDLDHAEIEAVLAHELGHFKRKHIVKRFVIGTVTSLLALALLGWLADKNWFYTALGITQPSDHAALLIFLLVLPIFTLPLTPLSSLYSRKHEFEADEFAVQNANGGSLVSALVVLYRENASTLTPDPVHSAFYDSHPPAPVRISRLRKLAGGHA